MIGIESRWEYNFNNILDKKVKDTENIPTVIDLFEKDELSKKTYNNQNTNQVQFIEDIINPEADTADFTIVVLNDKFAERFYLMEMDNSSKLSDIQIHGLLAFENYGITRPFKYNQVLSKLILNNAFAATAVNLELFEKQTQAIDYKYLRVAIIIEILKHFNPTNLHKEVHNPDNEKIIIRVVILEFQNYIQRLQVSHIEKVMGELVAIFLTQLNEILKTFLREMHDNYLVELSKMDDITNLSDNKKQKIFEDILDKSLHSIINEDTNIYREPLLKLKRLGLF